MMVDRPMMIGLLVLVGVSLLGAGRTFSQERPIQTSPAMTMGILQRILNETVENLKGENGQWRFSYADVEMALLTSVPHDRMRIVAPIGPEPELTDRQQKQMLNAIFTPP